LKFDGGVAYYFIKVNDSQSNPDLLSGSVRWVYDKPQNLLVNDLTEVTYTSKEATILLHCKEKTFAMPDYSFHNKSEVVHWVSVKPDEINWQLLFGNSDVAVFAKKLYESCL
jgi:hypothetical protein